MTADVVFLDEIWKAGPAIQNFKEYQKTGTRFYGFKIGEGQSNWDQYFDKIYEIHYRPPRMY